MSRIESDSVTVTTNSGGTATGTTRTMNGRIVAVRYMKDTYADGVDFTITNATTGQSVWTDTNVNASEIVYPKQLNDGPDGADLTGAYQPMYLADEKVQIVIAQGGDTKSGTFTVYVER